MCKNFVHNGTRMVIKRGKTVEYIISFMETYGYGAMFIAMVLENANIPIPSEIVLGFAGYLIAQGIFDLHTTMVVGTFSRDCRDPSYPTGWVSMADVHFF